MKKLSDRGFSAIEGLLILFIVGIIGGVGYYVFSNQKADVAENSSTVVTETRVKDDSNKEYILENEGLAFSYNPKITTVTAEEVTKTNDTYLERVKVITGQVTLYITAGIDGIGGGSRCAIDDRGTCEVVDKKSSTFLGKPLTYELIKAMQVENCGSEGYPSCDVAPLVTSFFLDTDEDTPSDTQGECCGTIDVEARNTGKKSSFAGNLLITVDPDKNIQNEQLLKQEDLLVTLKIIESIHY